MRTVWIVGKTLDLETAAWDFRGAYDNQNLAEQCCIDEKYFVYPCVLNKAMPADRREWHGTYYPKLEPKKEASPSVAVVIIELPGRTQAKRSKTE